MLMFVVSRPLSRSASGAAARSSSSRSEFAAQIGQTGPTEGWVPAYSCTRFNSSAATAAGLQCIGVC
jgi:hypothetical protein